MPSAVPTRRSVVRVLAGLGIGSLGAGALSPLAGCTKTPSSAPSPQREPDPVRAVDLAAVARALATSQDLTARYAAAIAAFPDLAGLLVPLEAEHAAHVAALDTTPASGTAAPPSSTASGPAPAVAGEALAALAAAERASAAARVADLLAASPAVARLLASIAACQAAHAAVLGMPT